MNAAAVKFEFAPGARPVSRAGRIMLASVVLLLATELVYLGNSFSVRQREAALLADIDARRLRSGAAATPAKVKPDPAYIARVKSARQVATGLATPWSQLLDALESAPQEAVALLAIEPSVAKRSIRLTAEARDASAMLTYLGELQKDRRLSSVVLVSHQVQVQAPGTPVRFQIQAGWGDEK